MRALVMAAGLGTRLRPLTNFVPKPLVPVRGRPMVEYVLEVLAKNGITEAVINVHYLPGAMRDFVEAWNLRGGIPSLVVQDESSEILGSGGAVAKAAPWLFEQGKTAVVCNSDVIADPDLLAILRHHEERVKGRGVECTLAAIEHAEAGVKYNGLRREGDLILGFEQKGAHDPGLWQFPGYYLLESAAVKRLPAAGNAFSIVHALWQQLAAEKRLGAFTYRGPYFDLGSVEDLRAADEALAKAKP